MIHGPGEAWAWYVYDRDGDLLHIAETVGAAERWSLDHLRAVEVASRQEIADNDYLYLLVAPVPDVDLDPQRYRTRDRQVRIMRGDRVVAVDRDLSQEPRFP
ncbi:hypothetical protein [Tenggerimyces flavus]|uniref:Uncharacterized protein n=1 Tax=Tenggerimyces flavus TaxID=1708749 RepID=A0ABV7YMB7_9ACTN|nr:hypothetical protein [Tenggerimyces flavus]MBM7789647.1 hypothetical protein [Tenggerimyces flavus]